MITNLLIAIGFGVALIIAVVLVNFGTLWLRAYLSDARVRLKDLIGMRLRNVSPSIIVNAKIMAVKAGIPGEGFIERRRNQ